MLEDEFGKRNTPTWETHKPPGDYDQENLESQRMEARRHREQETTFAWNRQRSHDAPLKEDVGSQKNKGTPNKLRYHYLPTWVQDQIEPLGSWTHHLLGQHPKTTVVVVRTEGSKTPKTVIWVRNIRSSHHQSDTMLPMPEILA